MRRRTLLGCIRHWEERNLELVRENDALRSNNDRLSSENASLAGRLKKAEEIVLLARELTSYAWEDRLKDCKVSDDAKHDSRKLGTAVWRYYQDVK